MSYLYSKTNDRKIEQSDGLCFGPQQLLGNALCLYPPNRPAQAVPERGPKILAIDFAVKTFDYLLEWPSTTRLGAKRDFEVWT